ncbi:MAG: hypothetical protein U0574_09940 [Phycisphaerales bacterium]
MKNTMIVTGAALAAAVASLAFGDVQTAPTLSFGLGIGGSQFGWQDSSGAQGASSMWEYKNGQSFDQGGMVYALEVDPDPYIGFSFEFFNNTASTQLFSVTMTLPVGFWNQGSLIGASIGGSVTDANFDGVGVLSSAGGPIFDGKVDGSTQLTLFNDPFSVSVPFFGATATLGPETAGLPGPSIAGPGLVTTDMSITLTFSLTAGDRASFTGIFVMQYIPAPAGVLALAGLVGLRRRRTA